MAGPQEPPLSAREKIARLRETFVAQLPERIAQMRILFDRLRVVPSDQAAAADLHRLLHNIKGTGRSFGFHQLGAAALLGETLAVELTASPGKLLSTNGYQKLGEHLNDLAEAASLICSPEGVDADSNEPGFTLPASIDKQPVDSCRSEGRMVYVCDDDELLLEQLVSQLSCFGFEAIAFTDPWVLHDAVLARQPDAVIMDINFPLGHSAGTEVLAELKQETGKQVPAIFLSARDDFAARLGAIKAGGEAYFHKPARLIELVAALDEITNQQQLVPYRILVVDDEPEIASYHCIILQEAGMVTCQLSEPSRTLQVLQEFHPDMVLMDMYMPACNGRDLAKLIRQVPDYIGLPIVFLSSEMDQQKQFSAMRVGAEGFLTKPVIPADLVSAVAIRAERMRALRSLMARDSLTGLFNHTTTTQLLDNALATAKRSCGHLCFAMIDIDRFKSVNDTHGHSVGDQVILALSRVLQQRLRNSDVVGRYGGEEFAVILQDTTVEKASRLIDELRQNFSRVIFHSANVDFSCSFSAGVAAYPQHSRLELLREAADKALYEAKRSGRNRVVADY